jgi:hypothetical protein
MEATQNIVDADGSGVLSVLSVCVKERERERKQREKTIDVR